jgi:hypothetical protein
MMRLLTSLLLRRTGGAACEEPGFIACPSGSDLLAVAILRPQAASQTPASAFTALSPSCPWLVLHRRVHVSSPSLLIASVQTADESTLDSRCVRGDYICHGLCSGIQAAREHRRTCRAMQCTHGASFERHPKGVSHQCGPPNVLDNALLNKQCLALFQIRPMSYPYVRECCAVRTLSAITVYSTTNLQFCALVSEADKSLDVL